MSVFPDQVKNVPEGFSGAFGFWPDAVCIVSCPTGRITGTDDIEQVNISVTVLVIFGKIHAVINSFTCIGNEPAHIVAFTFTVIFQVIGELYWSVNIKLWDKRTETHVREILCYASVVISYTSIRSTE